MDTLRIAKKQALTVAHRGLSALERENSIAAFVAAGQRSYFGIETDVHKTKDGAFILIHDNNTSRVSPSNLNVEESTLEELSHVRLYGYDGKTIRADHAIPMLHDYIAICRHYDKTAVLELKSDFSVDELQQICQEMDEGNYLDRVVFIAFNYGNLLRLREFAPDQPAQFLMSAGNPKELIDMAKSAKLDLDVHYAMIDKDFVDACHQNGIKVNVWTVDDPEVAARVIDAGVDFITTNRLE